MNEDNHRTMAQRAGYNVNYDVKWWSLEPSNEPSGWYVKYTGPDASRRALRDVGPFDNEADAWVRAYTMAQEYRNG